MEKFKVTFLPDNKTVEVPKDTTILEAAVSAGVYINSACGGDGVCGRCKVKIVEGEVYSQGSAGISPSDKTRKICLACMALVQGDLKVEVPVESRADFEKSDLQGLDIKLQELYSQTEEVESGPEAGRGSGVFKHSPLATKFYLELSPPSLEDRVSDLERLYRQLRRIHPLPVMQTGLANIRRLGELLRSADWKVTATLGERNGTTEIVLIEPGDTSANNLGVCFDIGTTTLTGQLVDLNTKKVLGTKASYNKQAAFGSDVITRIVHAAKAQGQEQLHAAVCEGINHIIQVLVEENKRDLNDVHCVVFCGNTTMIHLLLRIDPAYIRRDPYVPTANFFPVLRAVEAGVKINPRGLLSCIPGVASYIGGDVTAGVLSSGLDTRKELGILIDIGTNGEIVLGNKDFLIACSASAGPAFEGSGVASGMRAAKGAIQKALIRPDTYVVEYSTIGGGKPKGICGSGYIDIIAGLMQTGLIDKSGKLNEGKTQRIRSGESGREFLIVDKEHADSSVDIVITEADIENIKRAKAAIYSACAVLLRHLGLDFSQIPKIFIAGGFGTYLDMENAIKIGLLPPLEISRYSFIGNSALAGSREVLLSAEAMNKADEIARKITYLELSVEPGYMDEYIAALFFPHTDLTKFINS